MPAKVKVKIIAGRNLPVMDRSSDTTDAFVEIKLGGTSFKTEVCRKSLNPQWNSDWYRFEVDDSELQDEPLQLRVMDYDTYSANDAIGKIYIDLNPLLLPGRNNSEIGGVASNENLLISGWIPAYDTMHGIRGELNLIVKVELFSDFNRYRQSSCGMRFFYTKTVPQCYTLQTIHGFVEELVVNDDPEYKWIDKIRTPRASNEARQTLFYKLSGELQRKIGVKAVDIGGNAVLGYCQSFDLEGESGIVARGIGTVATIYKKADAQKLSDAASSDYSEEHAGNYIKFLESSRILNPLRASEQRTNNLNNFFLLPPKPSRNFNNFNSNNIPINECDPFIKNLLQQEDLRGTTSVSMPHILTTKLKGLRNSNVLRIISLGGGGGGNRDKLCQHRSVAEHLARSVLQAQNSLGSILECTTDSAVASSDRSSLTSVSTSSSSEFSIGASSFDAETISDIVKNVENLEQTLDSKLTTKPLSMPELCVTLGTIHSEKFATKSTQNLIMNAPLAKIETDYSSSDEDRIDAVKHNSMIDRVDRGNLMDTVNKTKLLDKVNAIGMCTPPSPRKTKDAYMKKISVMSLPDNVLNDAFATPFLTISHDDSDPSSVDDLQPKKYSETENLWRRLTTVRRHKKKNKINKQRHSSGLLDTAMQGVVLDTLNNMLYVPKTNTQCSVLSSSIKTHARFMQFAKNKSGGDEVETMTDVGREEKNNSVSSTAVVCPHRMCSETDNIATPKGSSSTNEKPPDHPCKICTKTNNKQLNLINENFDMLEYPFLTVAQFPPDIIKHLGGVVCARSVKLLERVTKYEDPESRDNWWSEIRMEIRSHARALNCNAVLGYTESTTICEDVCVLSACGTAVVIRTNSQSSSRCDEKESKHTENAQNSEEYMKLSCCTITHLPYYPTNVSIRGTFLKCAICRQFNVPDILLVSLEIPRNIPTVGRGCFIRSCVSRPLKDMRGESNAKEISDSLPFLEYELHRLLVNKLKIKGMNSIFGLSIRISIGEKMLIAIACGTAMFLPSLPNPIPPKLVSNRLSDDKKLYELHKILNDTVTKNREIYQLKNVDDFTGSVVIAKEELEKEQIMMDLAAGNKDCCVLEVDDPEDAEVINLLIEEVPPCGFHVVTTQSVPGLETNSEIVKEIQMFTQVCRAKFQVYENFDFQVHRLLQGIYFKLRRMIPCALCDLQFRIDLPESDELQITIIGAALQLCLSEKTLNKNSTSMTIINELNSYSTIIFIGEQIIPKLNNNTTKQGSKFARDLRSTLFREKQSINITTLPYIPNRKIDTYLGNLNFFFIRETTSLREEGGVSGFIHSFITEILAIVRSHISALGGNAMVAYFMTEYALDHNIHKNQGQCLINIGGDVVSTSLNE